MDKNTALERYNLPEVNKLTQSTLSLKLNIRTLKSHYTVGKSLGCIASCNHDRLTLRIISSLNGVY